MGQKTAPPLSGDSSYGILASHDTEAGPNSAYLYSAVASAQWPRVAYSQPILHSKITAVATPQTGAANGAQSPTAKTIAKISLTPDQRQLAVLSPD